VGYCTITVQGIIEEANLTAAVLLGVARGDLVGQLMSHFVLPEDQDMYYRYRRQLFATAEPQVCRLRLLRPCGPPFWARLEATVAGEGRNGSLICRVVLSDISENKRAEAALAESELRYRTLADSGQALIWTAGPDKQCEYFNQPWLDFTGRTLEQEYGEGWVQGVHLEDLDRCLKIYVAAFDKREKFSMEYRLLHASGEYRWIQDDGTPRFDRMGQFLGYIGHCLDITARKKAEEKQEILLGQLIQAQKMESVGRLAGGVAHDFNNMLSIILGHVEMAQERLDPGSSLFADLEEVRKAAKRSVALTAQLLAFARKQIVTPKVLNLNKTMEGILRMLQRLIGENIDLAWVPGADLWSVRMDPSQLDQILANLCVNARDAIAGVGTIFVETKNAVFDAEYCAVHLDFAPGEYVLLVVSDNGCGMDKETLTKLFEPFFTTKEIGKGTGLGLATVYGIVKQNNGFIHVYSEPGHGTTFNIYLPRHLDKAELLRHGIPAAPLHGGHETILLVEDELVILEMVTIMLRRLDYTVLATATPGRAIELAEKHDGKIHLLLTDVIMPEMNGRDLSRRLLSLHPDLKWLFMSGYTADIIAHHGVLDEGVNFIGKPFTMKALATRVREVLDQEQTDHLSSFANS
jgi:two-component system, cell cycle sensor histidine kinase and response regulator CckA